VCIYGAPLVTLGKVIQERSTRSMPFLISLGNFASSLSWSLYAMVVVYDINIAIPSVIGLMLSSMQLAMFVIYGFGPPRPSHT
jgi:solute carrier family 50 protein (sugar transporter)